MSLRVTRVLAVIAFLSFWGVSETYLAKKSSSKPNVVLIVVDTLRADHLQCYGYPRATAPFMSELARHGVQFEKVYAQSSWTPPSTTTIVTGLYPFQHGVINGMLGFRKNKKVDPTITINRIPNTVTTLAEYLKEAGYRTYAITDNLNICHDIGFDRGFDRFINHDYKTAEIVVKELLGWRDEILTAEPWFLYLHFNDPHQPLRERMPLYEKREDYRENVIQKYDSEIRYVDAKIAELYREFGWQRNTLIVITADHGEELWDHNQTGHGYSLYNEVIRVPLILQFPDNKRQNLIRTGPAATLDIFPTIAEYLGLEIPNQCVGQSLLTSLKRKQEGSLADRTLYSYLFKRRKDLGNQISFATIEKDWKCIIVNPGANQHLHYLKDDPQELNNLRKTEKQLVETMAAKYTQYEQAAVKHLSEAVDFNLDQEKIESLQSLGYIE